MTHKDHPLAVRRAESVPESASVRHIDQLSEQERAAFHDLRSGESRHVPGLEAGEVVVFTSYFRVVQSSDARRVETGPEAGGGGTPPDSAEPSSARR